MFVPFAGCCGSEDAQKDKIRGPKRLFNVQRQLAWSGVATDKGKFLCGTGWDWAHTVMCAHSYTRSVVFFCVHRRGRTQAEVHI